MTEPVPAPAVELYLIRHGNAKKLQGASYVTAPLTELGRQQATRTGEYLQAQGVPFDGYYSSALERAIETATLIGGKIGQTPTIQPGIQEMEYREIPATVAAELVARTGMLNRYFEARIGKPIRFPMIGRVAEGMLSILGRHPNGRVGIVVHGGVISSILAWYFPDNRRHWWSATVGNCSITRIRVIEGCATLVEFDAVAHLGDLAESAHRRNYTFTGDEGV
ncbi:MAG: histidine phosphatase family protein [Anaerolineae bacterium]|nr:histidine phosphatase family protein [Anaerolineae bacterium]